jgi:hypothetical protein
VLEVGGRIVWMQGVELEPEPEIRITVNNLEAGSASASVELPQNGALGKG